MAQGHTNREIAQKLVLSSGTVKVHVQRIIRKLCVSTAIRLPCAPWSWGSFPPNLASKPSLPLINMPAGILLQDPIVAAIVAARAQNIFFKEPARIARQIPPLQWLFSAEGP